ncbi:hypothetical protein L6164_031212 [Bauhinia variegata]|uniref:Uncharacterized protein n=1 Tax=Bauhinia variegata TaxID=167791 RepID=A0ACB9LES0_BAUVA|nr:hypothetical protein L6164_031212 [Bauhinia variegata]
MCPLQLSQTTQPKIKRQSSMMGIKKSWSFKKVSKELWPWRFSALRWKRLHLHTTIMDTVVFKILSVVEVVVLVSTLCFFFLCCGCHF